VLAHERMAAPEHPGVAGGIDPEGRHAGEAEDRQRPPQCIIHGLHRSLYPLVSRLALPGALVEIDAMAYLAPVATIPQTPHLLLTLVMMLNES
jgi:hypothetical protein